MLKPVLKTIPSAIASSSPPSCDRLALIILVPQNKKCLARIGGIEEASRFRSCKDSSVAGIFDTGTDSPRKYQIRVRGSRRGFFTCEHALIDDAITRKEKAICRKLCQEGICDFIDIPGHELTGSNISPWLVSPCHVSMYYSTYRIRIVEPSHHTRILITHAVEMLSNYQYILK